MVSLNFSMQQSSMEGVDDGGPVEVVEGAAKIRFENRSKVFYNPVQEFNRDLSVAVIREYLRVRSQSTNKAKISKKEANKEPKNLNNGNSIEKSDGTCGKDSTEDVVILEALSASGLRAIRYAREISGITSIVANDISAAAVQAIDNNARMNNVHHIVKPSQGDASAVMLGHSAPDLRVDVVNVDPYGSSAPFLSSAVQCAKEGGLLCITCTDAAVLCGKASEKCRALYGCMSINTCCPHEMALRTLLYSIESQANIHGRYIEPLLSLSIDFYVRIFVRVKTGKFEVKKSVSKMGHVFVCTGCKSMTKAPLARIEVAKDNKSVHIKHTAMPVVDRNCHICGQGFHMGGPFWLDPIHNLDFVHDLIDHLHPEEYNTGKRMQGLLAVVAEELPDMPFYTPFEHLSRLVRSPTPRLTTLPSALLNAGYRVSMTHANKHGIKTDAPNDFVIEMMRQWRFLCDANDPDSNKKREQNESDLTKRILSNKSLAKYGEISFAEHDQANPASRSKGLMRFQVNPERFWGPKSRARPAFMDAENPRRAANQGKKRRVQGQSISNDAGKGTTEPMESENTKDVPVDQGRESE